MLATPYTKQGHPHELVSCIRPFWGLWLFNALQFERKQDLTDKKGKI